MIDRRSMLSGALAIAGAASFARTASAKPDLYSGPEVPFSFDRLIGWAKDIGSQPYRAPIVKDPDIIKRIDYDAYQQIKFRHDWAIWGQGDGPFPVELFHVGEFFKEPVRIFVVEREGLAREVRYGSDLFSYGTSSFARQLPPDTGFAGFRVMAAPDQPDWLAFLGASYFRAPSETGQYGLSARGLAIDTAMPTPEEFPRFSNFWLEQIPGRKDLIINALLESPSITGAYRFHTTREEGALMAIEAHLFPRVDIARVGIGPLTSMFWYGKYRQRNAIDWRPEIHDSDGLSIWTGGGERIWRPINNPIAVQTSSFMDKSPKGFGLLQRERRFGQYEDDGVFYNQRPTVWVEPLGEWGAGAVQLVEIPTNDEIHDNIVAYWEPAEKFRPGQHRTLRYKLHWRLDEPYPPESSKVIATRIGAGGVPGRPRPHGVVKYVVDFHGPALTPLRKRGDVEMVVSAPSGRIERQSAYPVVGEDKWRAMFDFTPASPEPVDLRLYLRKDGQAMSETWLFQHSPAISIS
jgi:glucans biosynthesis protein